MTSIVLAANNAQVGGGEVMLLATATALGELGVETTVVGPASDGGVLDQAEDLGLTVHRLPAERRAYLARLRGWAASRTDWLWCHGLVPALATSGRRQRIVHLHQEPAPRHRPAVRVARRHADRTLVPSHAIAELVPGSEVMWNWTRPCPTHPPTGLRRPVRVGFIGRHSTDKGLDVLARALTELDAADPGRWRLVLAGDTRFVPEDQVLEVERALARIEPLTTRLGWCAREDFLDEADVVAFPSTCCEAFGLVAAEAMSAGVPVVVSDAGALPEVVGPEHPWVAARGDPASLAAAITHCVDAAPAERDAVVAASRERWSTHFAPDAGRTRVATLLDGLGILPS